MSYPVRFVIFGLIAAVALVAVACGDDHDIAVVAPAAAPAAAPQAPPAPAAVAAPAAPAPAAPQAPAAPAPAAAAAPSIAAPAGATPVTARAARTVAPVPVGMIMQGGTLRHFNAGSLPNLDIVRQGSNVASTIAHGFYDIPFGWDDDLVPQPQMVDTWSISADAKEYTFTLRDGLKFHDGTPVEAEDVTATILRWKTSVFTPGKIWGLAEPTLEVVDKKTFKINPTKPFGLWVSYWAQMPSYIMPKEVAEPLQVEDINTNYMGSGPFKFVSWSPGHKVVLERNDAYVSRTEPKAGTSGERIVHLDFTEHIAVPDAATKVAAMQTGQGEFADGLPNDFYQTLLDTPGLKVEVVKRWARPELATNKLYPPLNSPKSRLAILKMTDHEEYMRAGYGVEELWQLGSCLFFCGSQWESFVGDEPYFAKPDHAAAQVLWDEAVAETGFEGEMVLLASTDFPDFYAAALISKRNLEALGAEVDFVVTDWATVLSRKIANLQKDPQTEQGWHFYHTWSPPLDPLSYQAISDTWNGGWDNPRAQQLITDFSTAPSVQEAKDIVDEIHRIFWFEDPPTIPFGSFNYLITMQDNVKGYVPHRTITFDGVWLDR